MTTQIIPLSQLTLSPFNVRKVKPKAIEQLAADIASHGLLQNLVGYAEGNKFEIVAGGRRYRALKWLAKAKTIANNHPVSVEVRPKAEAIELSLAENVQREAMHTADAVRAYGQLHTGGMASDDIAARFGVSLSYVKKVLRLSALHPAILAAFAKDEIGFDVATALTLTDDQDRQLLALKQGQSAYGIRRFLTVEKMGADNGLFVFVGRAAYQDAGGTMTADLFAETGEGGYADDPALIERLASAQLAQIEADYSAQGWQDVRTSLTRPDDYYNAVRMSPEGQRDLSPQEAAQQEALTDAMATRLAEIEGQNHWDDDRLRDLRNQVRAIENGLGFYTDDQRAHGAMMLFVGSNGLLEAVAIQTKRERNNAKPEAGPKPDYSGAMVEALSKIKTQAVQEAIASDPALALDILIDGLAAQIAGDRPSHEHPLSLRVEPFNDRVADEYMTQSSINPVADWQGDYFAALPTAGRFEAIRAMDASDKAQLLAIMVARMVNGVVAPAERRGTRHDCFDRIAFASGVDLREKWTAPEAFFAKLSKPTMLKALTEAVSADAATNSMKMKKGQLAATCAKRMARSGWLPPALHIEAPSTQTVAVTAQFDDEAFGNQQAA